MRGVTVLENKRTIVAFETVEDDYDVLVVAVCVDGKGCEVLKLVGSAVWNDSWSSNQRRMGV